MKYKKLTPFFFSASLIGSFFQWYNYTSMSLLAPIILSVCLPQSSPITQVVSYIFIYSSPLFTRMLGAIGVGNFADTFGRKPTILLTVFMMTVGILGIAFSPSYTTLGFIAPAFLIIFSLIHGISSGAEWAALATYITESTPPPKCQFYVSFINVSEYLGILVAQTVITIISLSVSTEFLHAQGWRIVLFIGSIFGIIGCFQRRRLNETPVLIEAKKSPLFHKVKFGETLWRYKGKIFLAFGIATLDGALLSFFLTHSINFFPSPVKENSLVYYFSNVIVLILGIFLAPIFGKIAEKIGGLKLQLLLSIFVLIGAYPFCQLFFSHNPLMIVFGNILFGIPAVAYLAPMGAVLSLLFPPEWRISCLAIATSLSFALFAGAIPLYIRYAIPGSAETVPFYVMFCALFSLLCIVYLIKTKKKSDHYLAN